MAKTKTGSYLRDDQEAIRKLLQLWKSADDLDLTDWEYDFLDNQVRNLGCMEEDMAGELINDVMMFSIKQQEVIRELWHKKLGESSDE